MRELWRFSEKVATRSRTDVVRVSRRRFTNSFPGTSADRCSASAWSPSACSSTAASGLTGSFSEVIERVGRRSLAFDWRGWVLIGLVAGSVLFAIVGAVFGVTLSGSGLTDPEVIRSGLLFEQSYLFLFFAAALGVAFAGTQLLRLMRPRALLTGERVDWVTEKPDRRRFGGAVLFGTGWAVTGACPGPIAAQLGQGVLWSVFTLAGVVIGIVAFLAVQRRGRGERGLRRRLAADRYALAVDGKQL